MAIEIERSAQSAGHTHDAGTTRAAASGGEFNLGRLVAQAWAGKITILAFAVVFAIGSVVYALLQPNVYHSSALLAPAEQENNGIQNLLGEFGGLASLAGIQARAPAVDKAVVAMETMRSRLFLRRFIAEHGVLVPLFAARKWDRATGRLLLDTDIYDPTTRKWSRHSVGGRPPQPTPEEAYDRFNDLLSVTQDKKTGLVSVSVDAPAPTLAKEWVDALVHDVNEAMRASDLLEAERSITYLQKQLPLTQVADIQKVFYSLIEQQTKTKMLAQVRQEYAFKTIDPATAPERKARPARALICIFGTLFGGMLGLLWVLIRRRTPPRAAA